MNVLIKQYSLAQPSELLLRVYADACRLDTFEVHAGDTKGVLKGTCLDLVDSMEAAGVRWNRVADSGKELWVSAEHPEKLPCMRASR